MAAIKAWFSVSWLVSSTYGMIPLGKLVHTLNVTIMPPNCDYDSIWKRREPMVEIKDGCGAWPMVQADGSVTEVTPQIPWVNCTSEDVRGDINQVYTRSWVDKPSKHTAIVYAYFNFNSMTGAYMRYYIIWFRDQSAAWETARGCSAFGFDVKTGKIRWAHFDWHTCSKAGYGKGDAFRIKIVMDEYDLWPGDAKGIHTSPSYLLMWLWMPTITIEALYGVNWDYFNESLQGIIFEKGIWGPSMERLYAESLDFFASKE